MKIREQGWECPKCGRVWAPRIGSCGACIDRQTLPPEQVPTRENRSLNLNMLGASGAPRLAVA